MIFRDNAISGKFAYNSYINLFRSCFRGKEKNLFLFRGGERGKKSETGEVMSSSSNAPFYMLYVTVSRHSSLIFYIYADLLRKEVKN